jgi:hypothetical protein
MGKQVNLISDVHRDLLKGFLSDSVLEERQARVRKGLGLKHICAFLGKDLLTECRKEVKTNVDLRRHELTHIRKEHGTPIYNMLPFLCDLCGDRFVQKRHLMNHTNTAKHGGVRDQVCVCGKASYDPAALARHIKTEREKGDGVAHGRLVSRSSSVNRTIRSTPEGSPLTHEQSQVEQEQVAVGPQVVVEDQMPGGSPTKGLGAMAAGPSAPAVDLGQGPIFGPMQDPFPAALDGAMPFDQQAPALLEVLPLANYDGPVVDHAALYVCYMESQMSAAQPAPAGPTVDNMSQWGESQYGNMVECSDIFLMDSMTDMGTDESQVDDDFSRLQF